MRQYYCLGAADRIPVQVALPFPPLAPPVNCENCGSGSLLNPTLVAGNYRLSGTLFRLIAQRPGVP